MEFQRFKHHPMVAELLKGGKRIAYGARAISEGGWQSMPKMVAPGVALLGCSVGMVNVPSIKGNHNAMLSGIAAAEAAHAAIKAGRAGDELSAYETEVRSGPIGRDLKKVRNVKPLWSQYGLIASLMGGGADMWLNTVGLTAFGTLRHRKSDAQHTGRAKNHKPIDYPKPDGVLSFDRLTNVAYSFTNHDEAQPAHLKLKDPSIPIKVNLPEYAEPAQRYCPAGVYEVLGEGGRDLPHQLPELRALQDLRHQGPQPEHHLDHAAGRGRAQLSQHVGQRGRLTKSSAGNRRRGGRWGKPRIALGRARG